MTIAENITDAFHLPCSLGDICLVVAIIGCIFMLMASACVLSFPNEQPDGPIAEPAVTVLKPLHGAEPGLPSRLMAFCRQHYGGPIQVLCGAQMRSAPAVAVVGEINVSSPDATVELVADPRTHGVNRQGVEPDQYHAARALRHARALRQRYRGRARLSAHGHGELSSASVGAVTCLYHGIGGAGRMDALSALAIELAFPPAGHHRGQPRLGQTCCGATIALRRPVLDRIGGFQRACRYVLADDHAIGVAVRAEPATRSTPRRSWSGTAASKTACTNWCDSRSASRAPSRASTRSAYACTVITHPWPLALIGHVAPAARPRLWSSSRCCFAGYALRLHRMAVRLAAAKLLAAAVAGYPCFGIFVTSFFGATVHWQGWISASRAMAPCLKARICEDRPDGHLRGSPCARCFCRLLPSTVSTAAPARAIRPAAKSAPSGTRPGSPRSPLWCRTASSSTRSRIGLALADVVRQAREL